MKLLPVLLALGGIGAVTLFYLKTNTPLPAGNTITPGDFGSPAVERARSLLGAGRWMDARATLDAALPPDVANAAWHALLRERS